MANEQNLRPPYSPSEARENGKKGGTKSGESKRRSKTIRDKMKDILSQPVTDKKQLDLIKKSGFPVGDKPSYLDYICASAIVHAAKNGRMDDILKMMNIIGESLDDTNMQTLTKAEELLGGVDSAID